MKDTPEINWLEPWGPMPSIGHGNHEAELAREVGPRHPLYGVPVTAIAVRGDNDDVLFAVETVPRRYAVVHLTWSHSQEADPMFPTVEFFRTLEDWIVRGMRRDHTEWLG